MRIAPETNGRTPDLRVEYDEAVEQQKATDQQLESANFTGASFDSVTGDWCIWLDGVIVGWARTQAEAARRATSCHLAQLAHVQPVTLTTARDELPCSVEFQRAKDGTVYWTLKGYHAPGDEDTALTRLQALDDQLLRLYRPELTPAS